MNDDIDKQIEQQIARAKALLDEVAALRLAAASDESGANAGHDQRQQELQEYRRALSSMLDDVTELQVAAERLARRLDDLIDVVEGNLIPAGELLPLPGLEQLPVRPEPSPTATVPPIPRNNADLPGSRTESTVAPGFPAAVPEKPTIQPVQETVVVHGVPDAQTGLALKRFLRDLSTVVEVSTHEYRNEVLRLELRSTSPLTTADLDGWDGASAALVDRISPELIEIRMDKLTGTCNSPG